MSSIDSTDLLSAKSLADLRAAAAELELGPLGEEPLERWTGSTSASERTVDLVQRLAGKGLCGTIADLVTSEDVHKKLFQTGGRRAEKNLVEDLQAWLAVALNDNKESPPSPELESVSPGILHVGMDEDALNSWARTNRVARWLSEPVQILGELLARRTDTWLWQHDAESYTLGTILAAPTAASAYWPKRGSVPRAVQDTVIQFLLKKSGQVQMGQSEDAQRLQALDRPIGNPALLDLWERLLECRAEIAHHSPPLPGHERGRSSLHFEISPPRVIYIEEDSKWCSTRGESRVEIDPKAEQRPSIVRCTCEQDDGTRCSLTISALDALLAQFNDLSAGSMASQLSDILDQPHWSRALEDFDQVLRAALPSQAASPLDYELGWRVRRGEDQRFTLEPIEVRARRSGGGIKTRKADLSALRSTAGLCTLPIDFQVTELLLPDPEQSLRQHRGITDTETVHRALDLLVGHPRIFTARKGADRAITVRRSELALHWNKLDDGSITIQTAIDNEPVKPERLAAAAREGVSGGCLVELNDVDGVLTVTPIQPGVVGILSVLEQRGSTFAVDAGSELLGRLHAFSRLLPVLLSETLRGMEMATDSRPMINLKILPEGDLDISIRVQPMAGVESWFPGRGPRELYGESITGRVFCRRDFAAEERFAQEVLDLLPPVDPLDRGPYDRVLHDPDISLDFIEALQEQASSVKVMWPEYGRREIRRARDAANLKLEISGMDHWLGIDGMLEVDTLKVPAQDLFESLWAGRRFVKVGTSGWIRIEDELIEQLSALSRCITDRKEGLYLSTLQSLELVRLEEAGLKLDAPVPWRLMTERIHNAHNIEVEIPSSLDAELRGYQEEGFRWLARLSTWSPGACLADDMGLGKTVQTLALLSRRAGDGPALVVAPTSVGFNWLREAERFAPHLRARMYRGSDRAKILDEIQEADLIITSYGLVARDEEKLSEVEFSAIVLDEAQAIKNPNTRRARSVLSLKSPFKIALTGTPIENRIGDLWSIFASITPGLLGSREQFRKRFLLPGQSNPSAAQSTREALARSIRPFILRRTKEEVALDLPDRTSILLRVSLSRAERLLYNEMRNAAVAGLRGQLNSEDSDARRFQVLAALTRLRQLACHPRLVDPASTLTSSKLLMLRGLVEELRSQGHRALVFSQFTTHLALAREMLDEQGITYRYLDGSLSEPRRRMEVDAFQSGEGDVFLISLRAGGTGLNLTGASYVIHLDPWWNPAVEDQAADRAHRIGQKNPVTIYRLVAKDTIEEAIVSLQDEKRDLVATMLKGTNKASSMPVEELLELLSAQPPLAVEDEEPEDLMGAEDTATW